MKQTATLLLSVVLAYSALQAQEEGKPHHKKKPASGSPAGGQELIKKADQDGNSAAGSDQSKTLLSTELSARDLEFLKQAVGDGKIELWLGQQAKMRGQADQVKAVGETLATTQESQNRFIAKLAESKGLPESAVSTAAEQNKLAASLARETGLKFDKAIVDQILEAVKRSVDNYAAAMESKDPDIKAKAEQLLPMEKEKMTLISRMTGNSQVSSVKPSFHNSAPAAPEEKAAPPASVAPPAVK